MTKEKILLSAVGLIAITVSAIASKIVSIIYVRTTNIDTICELTIINATLIFEPYATTTVQTYATNEKGGPCTILETVYSGFL
ncbi:hypothetical protein SAMN05444266_10482 [Chitinophaga jiangningensis]|uniref:Uncharacterized protein n=1 Tax=Chitinophaga jiangningensis TaxID=1419482 RepID=A0A1M7BUU1_9BACT|nr:hypothetical protein [Chitinophaga jiangningensis]SHL58772.1 hypothetical protein SAMN05444266_10482 [Chitinophaga jiangningensis]